MIQRRTILGAAVAIACAAAFGPAAAQSYPTRPLTFYVAFGPGGAGDIVARAVAKKMGENMGQPVVIENRPAPFVAVQTVAKAKPDGHSMVMIGSGTALTSVLFKTVPYDLIKDFRHVSSLASFDLALVAGPQSPFKNLGDVLAYAKANPGKLNIGTVRIGSTQNLAAEMFKAMASIDAVIVPYKTTAEIVSSLRSGDIHVAFEILPPILSQVKSSAVKPLAVASKKRFPGLPNVATLAESGVPGFAAGSWNGLSVPAGTPPDIVARLAKEVDAAVASPEVQKQLETIGMVPDASGPDEMAQRVRDDMAKWKGVIDKANIPRQ